MKKRTRAIPRDCNGVILYEGPSLIDGEPIVVIATGFKNPSSNDKTGDMIQVWIMRSDIPPHHAKKTGDNHSVCGLCAIIDWCYVVLHMGPRAVFNAYKKGSYKKVEDLSLLSAIFLGFDVRWGAYGNPSLAPIEVIETVSEASNVETGYTSEWRELWCQVSKPYFMASVHNLQAKMEANEMGWRTYRVLGEDETLQPDEIMCPYTDEGELQCVDCGLCGPRGINAKNIAQKFHHSPVTYNAYKKKLTADQEAAK